MAENERALMVAQPKPLMMIKNLCPGLQEVGKIKIGNKGGKRQSQGGADWQPPQKLDHFLITTLERGADGNYIVDTRLHQKFGEKPKSIPVRLIYDDIALNFATRYIDYYGKTVFCSGDGECAQRLQKDGTYKTIACPCPRQDPKYGGDNGPNGPDNLGGTNGKGKCKINGILQTIIDGADSVGGVWKFRTTSYNTVVGIMSSLALISRITGGRLAGIPLNMTVSPKTTQDPIKGGQVTVYVVALTFAGNMETLRNTGYQIAMDEAKHGISMREIEQRAMTLISHQPSGGIGDETDLEVIEEFYPEEAQVIVMGEAGTVAQQALFGTVVEEEQSGTVIQQQAQPAAQVQTQQAGATVTNPPIDPATHHPSGRERGKPPVGKQRRTAAEVEEDRLADLRDQEAAQAVQQGAVETPQAAGPARCTCGSAVTRIDDESGDEYCDACGINLTQESSEPAQEQLREEVQQAAQPQAQAAPAAQQQAAAPAPAAGTMEDLF